MNKDVYDDEAEAGSSVKKVILDLLDQDIAAHPERLQPTTADLVRRAQSLIGDVSVDLYRQLDIEAYEESCLATSTKTVAAQTSAG
jgi:prlF antitoxin for toxin YhaV_toxin